MAKIDPSNGRYRLGGPKNVDLENIDPDRYNVYTEETKLAEAAKQFPDYNWFVSYTINDKSENTVQTLPDYTIKFDRPDAPDFKLYYYLNGNVHPLSYEETSDEGGKKRVTATLGIGDPPLGSVP